MGRQSDICVSNDSQLEIAIAGFFQCDNIPDQTIESPRFLKMLKCARMTTNAFKVPGRKKLAGPLLRTNYNTTVKANKSILLKDPDTWGISWMGDGATVKRMPLINCLGMSGDSPPIVVGVSDCTDHMASGGKKDAPYIAKLYGQYIEEYDPDKRYTDVFFFDGASNVQGGGRILEAIYPRAYCLHAGEHVVSLFFSDVGKLPAVKVRMVQLLCNVFAAH